MSPYQNIILKIHIVHEVNFRRNERGLLINLSFGDTNQVTPFRGFFVSQVVKAISINSSLLLAIFTGDLKLKP